MVRGRCPQCFRRGVYSRGVLPSGRGERAGGRRNKSAHFLLDCTVRSMNPRETDHSEQLARRGGGRGVVSTRAQVREWALSVALGHAASPTGRAHKPGRTVNLIASILAILLKIKHSTAASCSLAQIACAHSSCMQLQNVLWFQGLLVSIHPFFQWLDRPFINAFII